MKTCLDKQEYHNFFISSNDKPFTYDGGKVLGLSLECKKCLELYEIEIPLSEIIRLCIDDPSYIHFKASDDDND